jgi:hypothetical protein
LISVLLSQIRTEVGCGGQLSALKTFLAMK